MHKLVLRIYGILRLGTPFNPNLRPLRVDYQDGI
jgi:hypothetical protein